MHRRGQGSNALTKVPSNIVRSILSAYHFDEAEYSQSQFLLSFGIGRQHIRRGYRALYQRKETVAVQPAGSQLSAPSSRVRAKLHSKICVESLTGVLAATLTKLGIFTSCLSGL